MKKENSSEQKTDKAKNKFFNKRTIPVIIVICILILALAVLYIFKQAEINKIKKVHENEMNTLNNNAVEALSNNNIFFLETIGKVFSWTAQAELQRQNLGQLELMMTELVKVRNFKQIVILSAEGKVVLSTDKKFEGQGFPKIVYDLIKTDITKSSVQDNGDILIVSPIFGFDKRVGSLVITFVPEITNFIEKTN